MLNGARTVLFVMVALILGPGPQASASFVDNGNGTITDTASGLMWEKKTGVVSGSYVHCSTPTSCPDPHDVNNLYTWTAVDASPLPFDGPAKTLFLDRLNTPPCFAGHCDWRLPTIIELSGRDTYGYATGGIVDLTVPGCRVSPYTTPCINPIFGPTRSGGYWSSSTSPSLPPLAWGVDFLSGGVGNYTKTSDFSVRAVRSGSLPPSPTPTPTPIRGSVKAACGPYLLAHTGRLPAGRLYGGVAELSWSLQNSSVVIDNLKYAILDFNYRVSIPGILFNKWLQCGPGLDPPVCSPGDPNFLSKIKISSEDKRSGIRLYVDKSCEGPPTRFSNPDYSVDRQSGNNDTFKKSDSSNTCKFNLQGSDYPLLKNGAPLRWNANDRHFIETYFVADTRLNKTDQRDKAYCLVLFTWDPATQTFVAEGEDYGTVPPLDFSNDITFWSGCNPGDSCCCDPETCA